MLNCDDRRFAREGEASAEPALSHPELAINSIRHREGEATAEPSGRPKGATNPRKRPAHGVIPTRDHATVVFLTVCTKDRVKWLANPDVHELLLSVWHNARGWLVGHYVIMPDHIHLFAGWNGGKWSLETWCQFWKARFSVAHKNPVHEWQSGHWDTRMISYDQFVAKWEYVKNNPVRHKLVSHSYEWPFQGELHEFGSW